MPSDATTSAAAVERARVIHEYGRRAREIPQERYSPQNPVEVFWRQERTRTAIEMLQRSGRLPAAGDACLEIGHGRIGWLGELLGWGLRATDLYGVEVDLERLRTARLAIPGSHLVLGDGNVLPWPRERFRLVVLSTVLSSVLDPETRRQICREAMRVTAPGGAVLVYDFAFDNPRNPSVRRVTSSEMRDLFSPLGGEVRSLTLAPPLARRVVPVSRWLASTLALLPPLRTHRLALFENPTTHR